MIIFCTSYPPSVNHYYGNGGRGRKFIKPAGIKYRAEVKALAARFKLKAPEGRLSVCIDMFPPDKRRRDLDNVCKAALDALTHASVYADDCLIDDLRVIRRQPVKQGMLRIFIDKIKGDYECLPEQRKNDKAVSSLQDVA